MLYLSFNTRGCWWRGVLPIASRAFFPALEPVFEANLGATRYPTKGRLQYRLCTRKPRTTTRVTRKESDERGWKTSVCNMNRPRGLIHCRNATGLRIHGKSCRRHCLRIQCGSLDMWKALLGVPGLFAIDRVSRYACLWSHVLGVFVPRVTFT